MVAGDGPSFGPEAGDALNFGPTGRMGVPHLVHEQIFRNGFVKQDEELEGGARRERRGSPALPLKRKKKGILGECENPTNLNHRETKFLSRRA